jgi:hypothetical protein
MTENVETGGRDAVGPLWGLRAVVLKMAAVSIVVALILTPFRGLVGLSTALGVVAFAGLAMAMSINLIRRYRPLASLAILAVGCLAAVAVALPADVRPWWLLYPIAAILAVLYWKGRNALSS